MSVDELGNKYLCLRTALERAYGEPVWDSGQIDRLTDEIADTEFALAASGGPSGFFIGSAPVTTGASTVRY